jgi:hypothetical protein
VIITLPEQGELVYLTELRTNLLYENANDFDDCVDTDTYTGKFSPKPEAILDLTIVSLTQIDEKAPDCPNLTWGVKFKMPKLDPEIMTAKDPEGGQLRMDKFTGMGES